MNVNFTNCKHLKKPTLSMRSILDQKQQVFSKQLQSSESKEDKAQCYVMVATSSKTVKIYSENGTKI